MPTNADALIAERQEALRVGHLDVAETSDRGPLVPLAHSLRAITALATLRPVAGVRPRAAAGAASVKTRTGTAKTAVRTCFTTYLLRPGAADDSPAVRALGNPWLDVMGGGSRSWAAAPRACARRSTLVHADLRTHVSEDGSRGAGWRCPTGRAICRSVPVFFDVDQFEDRGSRALCTDTSGFMATRHESGGA